MLIGKRIYLRKIEIGDAPALFKWGKDPIYHKMAGYSGYSSLEKARQGAEIYSKRPYSYAIVLKENMQTIGLVELYERGTDVEAGLLFTKSIGFMLDKSYWHQGYMFEALTIILNYAFSDLRQNQIWAGTFSSNEASQNLLKKLGFRYVYTVDYDGVSELLNYKEKFFVLTPQDWRVIMQLNTKS
ncbi:RimJ/RimL family protein N-acetyltransferase [Lactobacillus colini]|uniref:RimJ/RimL family protein N-acetyltransferase n=1 Tax=Lactobacillus colini TaxID=1819254 RepID=A0ABS4MED4_9LACO|nr:GNAT family N-acetyltransferase [Lactobacillus colini]MBP2058040.1 RimJ/RimL family protein N-acetyltransferase [Lactobacillus colini]